MAALAFSPGNPYIFSFLYIAPFFIFLIENNDLKRSLVGTFIFSFIFLIITAYVVLEPGLFTISSIVFLGIPLSYASIKKILGEKIAIFSLPLIWTFWDLARAYWSLLPFTVLTAGNSLGLSPFVGIASIGELTALTLFSATINLLIALILLTKRSDHKKMSILITITTLLLISGYLFSKMELDKNNYQYSKLPNHLNIASVSIAANFDSDFDIFHNDELSSEEIKKAESMIQRVLEPLKQDLIRKSLYEKPDLVVLPEDMIDITITNNADEEAYQKYKITNAGPLIKAYRQLAIDLNTNLLSVMTTVRNGKRRISSILFDKYGEISGVYNKSTLTIGSEYWPFGNWHPFYYDWFGKIVPDIKNDSPIFDQKYSYEKGTMGILRNSLISELGSPICVEILYPNKIEQFKELGAKFIVHSSSNVWTVNSGLNAYLKLTDRIRAIESVWLNIPIIFNGRNEMAGSVIPNGSIKTTPYQDIVKNYGIDLETIYFK